MSSTPGILCSCGRRIESREVLQHGYFMNHWKPVWVFVKYRCSRCRMLGEQLVDYSQWDGSILEGETPAGEIDDDEVRRFAEQLRALRPSDLDNLARSLT
ncbi:MAG: hypothetical protein FJX74_23110 [Armatimonadetes bacterium]|nr:hypothetical protein [Armatimonadota bacterium]